MEYQRPVHLGSWVNLSLLGLAMAPTDLGVECREFRIPELLIATKVASETEKSRIVKTVEGILKSRVTRWEYRGPRGYEH